jgi:hypothetical protein
MIDEKILPVISEMILSSESLATNVTRIRALVCMSSLMNQEIVGLGKVSRAKLANVLFALSLDYGLLSQTFAIARRR